MESLEDIISKAIVDEFLNSSKYVTGIRMRILDKVMKSIDKKDLGQRCVHPDCSAAIEKLMESMELSQENRHLFLKILSGDHHEFYELYKMALILNASRELNIIFAVDGFSGSEYAAYIDHLQYKMNNLDEISENPNEIHVRAVRKLYERFDSIDVKDVYEAIRYAFNLDDEIEDEKLAENYIKFIGYENIDKVKSFMRILDKVMKSIDKKDIEQYDVHPDCSEVL